MQENLGAYGIINKGKGAPSSITNVEQFLGSPSGQIILISRSQPYLPPIFEPITITAFTTNVYHHVSTSISMFTTMSD